MGYVIKIPYDTILYDLTILLRLTNADCGRIEFSLIIIYPFVGLFSMRSLLCFVYVFFVVGCSSSLTMTCHRVTMATRLCCPRCLETRQVRYPGTGRILKTLVQRTWALSVCISHAFILIYIYTYYNIYIHIQIHTYIYIHSWA
jgi:hypothetical protein